MLDKLVQVLGARLAGRTFVFPCPLCQQNQTRRAEWRGEVRKGRVQIALVVCRRCGPEMARMLAVLGAPSTEYLRKGTAEEINREWERATGQKQEEGPDAGGLDLDLVHAVYSGVLAESDLEPGHRAWLENQGVPDDVVATHQYRTWPPTDKVMSILCEQFGDDLLKVPGFILRGKAIGVNTGKTAGILIPCRARDERIAALKVRYPRAKTGKYQVLSSAPTGPAGRQAVHWGLELVGDIRYQRRVRVVEGERKADVVNGFSPIPTVAIPGVGCGRLLLQELKALHASYPIDEVILAMDQDEAGHKGTLALAMSLVNHWDVAVETWDEAYKGLDDALVAGTEIVTIRDDSWIKE